MKPRRRSTWLARAFPPTAWMAILAAIVARVHAAPEFRAGADRSDITPALGTPIPGGFTPPNATHVHDPLHVRSLVLDDGATRIAFVVCDVAALPLAVCDEAKRRVTQQTGLPASHIVISATHTHSAGSAFRMEGNDITKIIDRDGFYPPSAEPLSAYQSLIARRVADSVQIAIGRLEPARVGWGAGRVADQVFNRRWRVATERNRRSPLGGIDEVRTNPTPGSPDLIEPAGPTDPEVAFLAVETRAGRPLAVLANYSLHYVGGGGPTAFSADYFGLFAQRLGELLRASDRDPPFVGMMTNGTSGDITGVDARQPLKREPPYVKMRRVADIVAAETYRAYQSVVFHNWVKLDARYEELPLQPRRPTPEMLAHANKVLARPAGEPVWHTLEPFIARFILIGANAPATLRVPVHTFRIGDLGIATAPSECFAEMGLELKSRTPFERTFTISLANGWFGYMPTPAQHQRGGYETWFGVNRLEKDAAPRMIETFLRLFAAMRATPSPSGAAAPPKL